MTGKSRGIGAGWEDAQKKRHDAQEEEHKREMEARRAARQTLQEKKAADLDAKIAGANKRYDDLAIKGAKDAAAAAKEAAESAFLRRVKSLADVPDSKPSDEESLEQVEKRFSDLKRRVSSLVTELEEEIGEHHDRQSDEKAKKYVAGLIKQRDEAVKRAQEIEGIDKKRIRQAATREVRAEAAADVSIRKFIKEVDASIQASTVAVEKLVADALSSGREKALLDEADKALALAKELREEQKKRDEESKRAEAEAAEETRKFKDEVNEVYQKTSPQYILAQLLNMNEQLDNGNIKEFLQIIIDNPIAFSEKHINGKTINLVDIAKGLLETIEDKSYGITSDRAYIQSTNLMDGMREWVKDIDFNNERESLDEGNYNREIQIAINRWSAQAHFLCRQEHTLDALHKARESKFEAHDSTLMMLGDLIKSKFSLDDLKQLSALNPCPFPRIKELFDDCGADFDKFKRELAREIIKVLGEAEGIVDKLIAIHKKPFLTEEDLYQSFINPTTFDLGQIEYREKEMSLIKDSIRDVIKAICSNWDDRVNILNERLSHDVVKLGIISDLIAMQTSAPDSEKLLNHAAMAIYKEEKYDPKHGSLPMSKAQTRVNELISLHLQRESKRTSFMPWAKWANEECMKKGNEHLYNNELRHRVVFLLRPTYLLATDELTARSEVAKFRDYAGFVTDVQSKKPAMKPSETLSSPTLGGLFNRGRRVPTASAPAAPAPGKGVSGNNQ